MNYCDLGCPWPATKRQGDVKLCDECNRTKRVRRRGNVVEVLPKEYAR